MAITIEELFAQISTELGLSAVRTRRFQAFDPESGAVVFFNTMEEMVQWVRS